MADDTTVHEMARSIGELNAQLNLALDLADIAVWRHDLATDVMHYDERAWRILGLTPRPEGLPIEDVRALIHPDDLGVVIESARRALQTDGPVDFEARYRHADGSWRHIMTRRAVQRDAQGKPIAHLGVALDMTDRVVESRRVLELARRLETITHAAGLGTWSIAANGESEWNAHMFDLFGLPRAPHPPHFDELLEHRVHPEDRERLARDGGTWLHGGQHAFEIEYRVLLPGGKQRWLLNRSDVDRSGGERRLYGVTMDITERKRTELALQEASERVALAAHGAGIGTWAYDATREEVFWDEQMFRLRGLEPGMRMPSDEERLAMVHPDDRQLVIDAGARSLRGEPLQYEFRVRRADGQWRWIASRSLPARDARGRVVRLTGANWDVTDARNAEQERQERIAAQRESLAKSQFLARMSHELRTPLNAVLGFAQLLLIDDAQIDAATRHRRLEHIRSAGEQLLSLVDDALELSRLQGGEVPPDNAPAQAPPHEPPPYHGHVIYIEDNPVNVLIVEELVARCPGLAFSSAPDGEQGVALTKASTPDLVLVDMQLPDFDGYEVLRRLRATPATAGIRCIALSANAMPEDIDRALAAGFADYWTKPIDFNTFLAAMETLFARRAG
jgi:PAS domain S-box-containing protein